MNISRYFRLLVTGLVLCPGLGIFGTNAFAASAYSGTFSGGNSGTWAMTVSSTGAITGTAASALGGTHTLSGQLLNGSFTMSGSSSSGATFSGTLNSTLEAVSGTWSNSIQGMSGTFTGGATSFALSIAKAGTGTGTVTSSSTTSALLPIPYTVTWHEVSGNCTLYPDQIHTGTLTPTVQGGNTYTTVLPVNAAITLTVPGSNTFTSSHPDGGGTTTGNYQLTFDALSHSIVGSENWTHTGGCMGYGTISGSWASGNSFTGGTSVTLSATPASGSAFVGWSGACAGTGTCTLSIGAAASVTATFDLVPFTAVATGVTAGVITAPIATVTTTISPNAADVGQTRSVFVTAVIPQSSLGVTLAMQGQSVPGATVAQPRTLALAAPASTFVLAQLTPTGWQQVVNGQLIPYTTGVLGAQLAAITLLNNADTTSLRGSQFCVGYGTSATEMNSAKRMQLIATVPDPAATSADTASCIVTTIDIRTYIPAASASVGYVSYLRVINKSSVATPVTVTVIDGPSGVAGTTGTLTASLPAQAAVTFTAQQVEAALGVTLAASDRPRIRVTANTPIETQSFLLQPGGAFSEISDALGGASTITIRNYVPAAMASSGYVSYLRVINTGTAATPVSVARVDPATGQTGAAGTLNASLPAGAAITYTATQIEAALGSPIATSERSRIKVTGANSLLDVQTFLLQPNGAFTNHSSGQTGSTVDVPNYVPAAVSGYTSFLRVINEGSTAAQVSVALIDDVTGVAGSSATLISSLPAAAAMTLTSSQVEAALGVSIAASTRPRIRISSSVMLAVQSFLLQPGGAFNEMSNVSSGTSVDVRTYIPAADVGSGYTSYLRVINTGVSATPVTVAVIDGATGAVGSPATLIASLPAGGASTFTPAQVEAALGIAIASGSRPRIRVTGNTALEVQSYLTQPGGAFAEVSGGQN